MASARVVIGAWRRAASIQSSPGDTRSVAESMVREVSWDGQTGKDGIDTGFWDFFRRKSRRILENRRTI
jgi:hypothetical protein